MPKNARCEIVKGEKKRRVKEGMRGGGAIVFTFEWPLRLFLLLKVENKYKN
jgi:hypothetical protein